MIAPGFLKNSLFWRSRDFSLLWSGQFVSSCGGWINYVALNVLLYEITGSGTALGLFFAVRTIPSLLFGAVGGFLADRFDKRRLMMACDVVRAASVLVFVWSRDVTAFFVLGFFLSAVDKIYFSCSSSVLPELVKKPDLMEANSCLRISQSVTAIVGPAMGGALVGFAGYKLAFMADSLTFVFSVATLLFITSLSVRPVRKGQGILQEFKEAFSFFMSSGIFVLFLILRVFDGFGSGAYNTVLPVFSSGGGSGGLYGWLLTSWGAGAFAGALAASPLCRRSRLVSLYCWATMLMAVGMGGAFLAPSCGGWIPERTLSLVSIALGGFGDGVSGVVFSTLLMRRTPKEMMGKVFGCVSSLVYMACGAGMYLSGTALDYFPYQHVVVAGTVLILFAAAFTYFRVGLRKIH